ncbi:iron-containing alcohol dehydrogenase [Micrococcus terreus]|uniref:iron-containing alcohol dehydrogenase family protein n=1 Tax=Micrococcus terreus TaxID=574650 RepID=UPI00295338C7|nr:iron-containing alcohol dehydrogenase [Micrococcus terreus]MDK7701095.1 iron-containing alcohol dehydrogenase [Micrococcus terreus]WOO96853.1 iron-containing alcohol dehydrogenase [Micrococcus terreus]
MKQLWNPSPTEPSVFLAPPVIVGGAGAAREIAGVLKERLGIQPGPILLAVDDAVLEAGLITAMEEGLISAGYLVTVRGGFGAEPSEEVVDSVVDEARNAGATAVIGVGGGSVLDSAKLISLMLNNPGKSADWLGTINPENGVAPMVLIPTTCGTGSEATRVAMVTVNGEKRASLCDQYVPQIAVLDADMVATLPPSVIAATGMDALAHATEALMSTAASFLSAHQSWRAIDLIVEHLEDAYDGDKDALAHVLWASHLAGQALNAGVVLGHSLAYCLAHAQPMPHGVSCAIALPYCLAYNQNIDSRLAESMAKALTRGESADLRVAAQNVADLAGRMGLPTTLAEARIATESIPDMARLCVGSYPRPTNPEPFDQGRISALFTAMETGDLDKAFAVTAA